MSFATEVTTKGRRIRNSALGAAQPCGAAAPEEADARCRRAHPLPPAIGRYTVGHDSETGKAIIRNVLGKTQSEVKEKLKKAIEENVGIDYGRAKTYTVGSWLEVWMENYAKLKLRPSTFKTSQGFLKNHIKPQIGSIPLTELTSLDLQRFYNPDFDPK